MSRARPFSVSHLLIIVLGLLSLACGGDGATSADVGTSPSSLASPFTTATSVGPDARCQIQGSVAGTAFDLEDWDTCTVSTTEGLLLSYLSARSSVLVQVTAFENATGTFEGILTVQGIPDPMTFYVGACSISITEFDESAVRRRVSGSATCEESSPVTGAVSVEHFEVR